MGRNLMQKSLKNCYLFCWWREKLPTTPKEISVAVGRFLDDEEVDNWDGNKETESSNMLWVEIFSWKTH
jgi:hypothetical protein